MTSSMKSDSEHVWLAYASVLSLESVLPLFA
jgi:hypothetical protein